MSNPSIFFDMLGPTGEFHFEQLPDEAKGCVICLHGFSGSPWETRPVAESLFQHGFAADCPLHPAHGLKNEKEAKQQMKHLSATQLIENATRLIERTTATIFQSILIRSIVGGDSNTISHGIGISRWCCGYRTSLKITDGNENGCTFIEGLEFCTSYI